MRQPFVIMAFSLVLSLTGCASHKEVTAPCKRPAELASFAVEEQRPATPAALQLQKLGRAPSDCGPLYPVNPGFAAASMEPALQ
jgi:hypothetical protein